MPCRGRSPRPVPSTPQPPDAGGGSRGPEPPGPRRPNRLVVVAGTGTDVGKTWVAARLIGALRAAGASVAARKPAQSFAPGSPPDMTDAAVLGAASGEPADLVCPPARSYPVPMAPPMAAEVLDRPRFEVADLAGALAWPVAWPPGSPTVGIVESAGGVRSPLAADGDTVDLVRLLRPEVVLLVADAGLGTINAVRLAADALARAGAEPVVVLNRFCPGEELHARNLAWLADRDALAVVASPGAEQALVAMVAG
jgi:dethiobiotin synthetase